MSITRTPGHSCGVLKGRSNLYQAAAWVRYGARVRTRASVWSLPAVDLKVIDVAGAVVAIHNVPREGDVGAVLRGLEVTNNFLGIYNLGVGELLSNAMHTFTGTCCLSLPHLWVIHTAGQLLSQWTTGEERLPWSVAETLNISLIQSHFYTQF